MKVHLLIRLTSKIHTCESAVGRAESACKMLCSGITNGGAYAVERKRTCEKRVFISLSRSASSAIRTTKVKLSELTIR